MCEVVDVHSVAVAGVEGSGCFQATCFGASLIIGGGGFVVEGERCRSDVMTDAVQRRQMRDINERRAKRDMR